MDDNLKEVLVLAITTLGTIAIAYVKIRGDRNPKAEPPATEPQHRQEDA